MIAKRTKIRLMKKIKKRGLQRKLMTMTKKTGKKTRMLLWMRRSK